MNALLSQVKGIQKDQSVTPVGYTYEPPAAGKALARFVGYIELGKRAQPDRAGSPRSPEYSVLLCFELNGKKHLKEINEETRPTLIYEEMTLKLGDKANFKKLFNKMRGARTDITHMAQMLNDAFLLTIEHNTVKGAEGKPDRVYANIRDKDGSWMVGPPSIEDPMSGEVKEVPVPEAMSPLRLLLWDTPSKEQWASLFVDGERTVKDKDGNEKTVSNNVMQQRIVKEAVDFDGSALQDLLVGLGDLTLTDTDGDVLDDAPEEQEPEPVKEPVKEPAAEPKKEAPKEEPTKADAPSVDDVFADLGL